MTTEKIDLDSSAESAPHVPESRLTNEEMINLDRQAGSLIQQASELQQVGDSLGAIVCMDQAIENRRRVADEMKRRQEWIMQKYKERKAEIAQSTSE